MNISDLKGLGQKKAQALQSRGIDTPEDLLFFFPASYEDRRRVIPVGHLVVGQPALAQGTVTQISNTGLRWGKKQVLKVTLSDGTGFLELIFFNGYYLSRAFRMGQEYAVFGTPSVSMNRLQMIHPEFSKAEESQGGIVPVYPGIKGITRLDIRRFVEQIMQWPEYPALTAEYLPASFTEKYGLAGLSDCLRQIHFPTSPEEVEEGKRRFLYEDLFVLQLGLSMMREPLGRGRAMQADGAIEEYLAKLPFPMTGAQLRTLGEIEKDMESEQPMNRLVQGDVGSGKTAVAEGALYKAVRNGYQGAFMMPTEILAKQQYEGLKERFAPFGISVGLLTGSMRLAAKRDMLAAIEEGSVDIVVGTHALIQPDVRFHNLGLVITDEQHRFGVRQRTAIKEKGGEPDCLVMSATPIPRTLAMILFGDMDISVIDEMPEGRKAIKTKAVTGNSRNKVYGFVEEELAAGRQAYVVAPLIDDSEAMENVRSATSIYEELKERFAPYKVALLHGEMDADEKAAVMEAFAQGAVNLLVSTVVIEVGINVQNATVMVIENAERFGLSQMHQLRGRVGRGREQSYCILITEDLGETSLARAKTMTESSDGFYIAEQDLQLRGPGELFGDRQHGVPSTHLVSLLRHPDLFEKIKEDADGYLLAHPNLADGESKGLKDRVERFFGKSNGGTL